MSSHSSDPSSPPSCDLGGTRLVIDQLDAELTELVERRRRLVHGLWERKRASGVPVRDRERERSLLEAAEGRGRERGWPAGAGARLLEAVMAAMAPPDDPDGC